MSKRLVSYRHTLINSVGTFLSRATGVLKQNVISYLFGASADLFWASFRIVNSFRRYIGEGGALGNSFIPVFQKKMAESDQENAFKFASNIINVFLLVTTIVTIIGVVFAPWYFPYLVLGFPKGSPELLFSILLTMIMMPYIIFICLYAIAMGVLNSFKKFFASSMAPLLFNVVFMIIPILFVKKIGIFSIGIAVVVGAVLMFVAQFYELYKIGFRYRFYLNFKDPDLRKFFSLFFPTSLNMVVLTVKNLVTTQFLSFFKGGYTVMMNSFLIIEAPLGFIGIAIGTVMMPLLSKYSAEKDSERFDKALLEGFNMLFYLIIPVSVFFFFFADTVVNMAFRDIMKLFTGNTGKYSPLLFHQTYVATAIYSLSLFPMGCTVLFEKIFYSLHDAKTPLRANVVVFVFSFGFYFASFLPSIGFFGVMIADTIAAWMTFVYYGLKLKKAINIKNLFKPLFLKFLLLTAIALAAAIAIFPIHSHLYLPESHPSFSILLGIFELAIFSGIYYIITKLAKVDLKI